MKQQRSKRRGVADAASAAQDYSEGTISMVSFVRAAGFGALIGFFLRKLIVGFFRALWHWRYSVLTIGVVAALIGYVNEWAGLAVLAVAVVCLFPKATREWVPFYWDWDRHKVAKALANALSDGNEFIRAIGVVPANDEAIYPVELWDQGEKVQLNILAPLPRADYASIGEACKRFMNQFDAKRVRVSLGQAGAITVVFLRDDPLDEGQTLTSPAPLDVENMSVECSVNSDGDPQSVTFGNSSGMVVGGIPGSGKTAGVTSFLLPLALSDYVDLSVIDGKGGQDWESYGPRCSTYIRGDEDLGPIVDFLSAFHAEMLDRLDNQKERLGTSNFWNASASTRLEAGERFKLLVIDECQGIFETSGRSKEEKEQLGQILRYCSAIVKRGRSAGFFIIFITQKPTSEALPTSIRDNAGLRIAFRLTTTAAEQAVLGATPDDPDSPRALSIPSSRKGGAVLATDTGKIEYVRFYYIPEDIQGELLKGNES